MKKLLVLLFLLAGGGAAHAASCSAYTYTLQNNTTADATQVMSNFNTVRNCVINNTAGSGVNTDITSLTGLTTPLSVPQGGTPVFIGGTSTGATNAFVVSSTTPTGFTLTSGYRVTFTAGSTNTGAATLNVNSTGATALRKLGTGGLEALTGSEIVSGNFVEAVYNGTVFVLISAVQPNFSTATTLSAATTTDLGTIPSHNVSISGSGVSITGFGSSAVASAPIYFLKFAGANTLTYNATSLIIPGAANITTAANDTAVVEYLGSGNWQVLQYQRASGTSVIPATPLCGATGFTMANNSGTPNTNVDMAADSAVLLTTAGAPITVSSVSVTVNATTTGANGLDAGSLANNTWYHFYLISNGNTTAGLASTSATSPTMPSGYTYKCRLGARITDGSANFLRLRAAGSWTYYVPTSATTTTNCGRASSGIAGTWDVSTPTWTTPSIASLLPPTATDMNVTGMNRYGTGAAANVIIAPTSGYAGVQSTNPPPIALSTAIVHGGSAIMQVQASTIAYVSDSAGGAVFICGWKDKVNAD